MQGVLMGDGKVSLRLGRAAALTIHRIVIHYRNSYVEEDGYSALLDFSTAAGGERKICGARDFAVRKA